MKYTCKNCGTTYNSKTLLYKCIKCNKSICEECACTIQSNVVIDDNLKICKECFYRERSNK